jgi:hypothetical protein
MGVVNSYERLKLSLGSSVFFEVGNRPEGGARVCIGAKNDV